MSTSQFTNQQIADYVSAVMGGAGTDAEKAAAINAAAQQYDVTREQLAASTGYGLDVVNQYLGALPTTNAGMTPTSTTGALSTLEPVSAVDSSPLDFSSGFKQFVSNLPEQTQLTEQQQAQNYYNNLLALNPTATKETINTFIKETPFSSPYYDELLTLSGGTSTTPTSTGALSTVTTTGATTRGLPTSAVDTVTSPVSTDTTQSALSSATATGALPTSTTQGALQTATSPTQSSSVLDVFGLDWNTAADLATKQGYIQTLLNQGVTPEELKNKIYELDPASATAANFYALGIDDSIRDAFLAIYDNPNKDPYEKAQEIKALIASSGLSLGDVAASLGLKDGITNQGGIDVLNTFLNQPSPAAIKVRDSFAKIYNTENLSGYEKATQINQILSTKGVSRDQLSTALKIDKKDLDAFLDQPNPAILTYTKGIVGDYTDPVESKSLGSELAYSVAQKLGTLGIDSLNDIRVEVIPGVADRYEGDPDAGQYFIPGTPDVTKYYNKTTGKEIDPVLFDDKAGTKVVITPNGIQKQFDPYAKVTAQASQYIDLNSSSGDAWSYFGGQEMVNQIGQRLRNVTGIDDINDLELKTVIKPRGVSVSADNSGRFYVHEGDYERYLTDEEIKTIRSEDVVYGDGMTGTNFYAEVTLPTKGIYNKKTGQLIADQGHSWHGDRPPTIDLGGWGEGDGMTYAGLEFDANGKPKITTYGGESENWVAPALMVAAILAAPYTGGGSLSALGGGEAALAELGGLAALGEGAGAAASAGALPTAGSLASSVAAALPAELVEAGKTLYNAFNTVKPYLQAGNTLYQASQGNVVGTLLSGLNAAGSFGVEGAKELGQVLNAGLAVSQGNYLPVVQEILNRSGVSGELANTKIAGDFTIGDAVKGASFLEALRSEDSTAILNSLASLTNSQDLKVASAASKFIDVLNNPNATAFDIAMGVDRVAGALNTASKQPPPKGALPTGGQSTVTGALGTDTATGAAGNDVIDEYNVTGGGGALISSGNPTEDAQIAIQQRQNAANQALTDYMGPGNDLSREGLVSQLQSFGLTKDQAEGYAQQADQKINMNRIGVDVMNRYSKIDPEFGTPQLDRDTAVQEMVAAGFTSDRANEILNGIDAQNAIKLENKLSIQSAYNNFTSGKGTEEQLRSALTSAGYTDAEINNLVTRGNAILEGKKLTPGEQVQERVTYLADIRAEIAGKSSFNEAYALAREKLGPGATFTWQGKDYVASSAAERPDLTGTTTRASTSTATTDVPYIAPNGMHNRAAFIQAGGGTSDADYAKYVQAVNALVSEGKSGTLIKPASVNSAGKELPSTKGPVLSEIPRVDSVLGSVAAQGVASFGANTIGGALNALGFTNAGAAAINKANQLANAATAAEGADITQGKAKIDSAIDKLAGSSSFKEAATNTGELFSTIYANPKAFGATVGSEIVEEILQIGALKFLPVGFWTKELISSATENGGAAYNTEYDKQIRANASKEAAHNAAQNAAGVAAGTTVALAGAAMGLGKVVGKVAGSQADEAASGAIDATKQVGKTTIKESGQEIVEEGSIASAVDLALRGTIDAKNSLINMIGGGLYGGPTSGSMQATKLDSLDQQSTFIGSGLGADSASVNQAINNLESVFGTDGAANYVGNLIGSDNLAAGGQTLAANLANVMGSDAAVTTANTLVGNLAISKASDTLQSAGIDLENLSTVVGKTDSGNDITLGDALGASITGNGQQVADSTVVGTKADGTNLTLGDLSTTIKTGTAGATTGATTGVTTDATTNVATQTGVTGNVNANTSTTTDPNTGVTTNTAVDTNTGTTTTTTTDPNTNTTTKTTVDQNTGVNTQTTTTTDQTSTTTVDTNTNVTTNTTVNTNTNTTTNITVNTNTDEVVVKVTDNDTGEVLDTQIKTVDELTPSELAKLTITDPTTKTPVTKTPVTKTPVTKPPVATAPKTDSSAGFSMFGEIGRLGTPMLKSAGDTQIKNPLEQLIKNVDEMNQIDPALLAVMAQRLNIQPAQAPTFTYGQETSIDDILGLRQPEKPEMQESLYAKGGYVEPLRAKPMNLQFMNRGGALPGGREDFKGGKHVAGDGDGQSDDIPAWLADGEFVFPADVVSALGNGSTKAGTDKLYKMMHEIRARARSTKVKDLPPPAHKSPLDYIKKGK